MKDLRKASGHADVTIIETSPGKSADIDKLEPYLIILSGLEQGKQYKLSKLYNTFGRTSGVDIMINDSKVSRKHGVFIIHPDHIVLEDNNSTNGCFVNGIRVKHRKTLALTSRIEVGNTLMKIEFKKASEVHTEKAIYSAAYTDDLTHLLNRRSFIKRAQEAFSLCKRNNGNMAIIMCDVDHFKQINDTYGHPAGDHILKELAKLLHLRKDDIVARYGGEEFIILMRNTTKESARLQAERIRKTVEQFNFMVQEQKIFITISIGICHQRGKDHYALDAVIKKADDALYLAKKKGRNRIEFS